MTGQPYLGQVFISDQRRFFIYVGEGHYARQGLMPSSDGKLHAYLTPPEKVDVLDLQAVGDFRIYEAGQPS
jgi:hypothetical protein